VVIEFVFLRAIMVTTAVQDVEMKDADSPAEVDPAEQKKDADLAAIEGEKRIKILSVFRSSAFCMHPHPSIQYIYYQYAAIYPQLRII
jgi:hypothetical protein